MPLASQSFLNQGVPCTEASVAGIELAQEVLANFGYLRLGVTGGSMLPSVVPGDVLSFVSTPSEPIEPGQVILTRFHGRLVAHRLLACLPDGLLTQGDALLHADPKVLPADVLGVMVSHQRGQQELRHVHHYQRLRPGIARWVIRHSSLARRVCLRWPQLAGLMA